MKKMIKVVGILAILFAFTTPAFAVPGNGNGNGKNKPPVTPPPASPVMWGAYTGNNDQTMASFEAYVSKSMPVHAMFWGWDSSFPQTIAGSQGKTLLIYWEPAFGFNQINNGSKDAYIAQFAQGAKAYGYPVILVPFDEFNLNEAPWGNTINGNTPESFIAAWQRVRNIFTTSNATNVKFGLAYNNVSIPSVPYASFYPGNAYVDYVGIDGFNFGTQTFASVFSQALTEARAFGKPVWILSAGSVAPKSQFILDLGASGVPWIWFNQAPYNIDSSSLAAFKTII